MQARTHGITASREFTEETGAALTRPLEPLGEIRQRGGKRVIAFAVEGDVNVQTIKSNSFEIEWPPKSGKDADLSGDRPRRMVRSACRSWQNSRRPAAFSRPARRTFGPTGDEARMTDPFDLQRFVDAQAPVYRRVTAELRQGQKQSHWIWFIFPSLPASATARWPSGLPSPLARSRGLSRAWRFGTRLRECTALVNAVEGRTIREILGSPDDLKFRSSMTLFGAVSSESGIRRGNRQILRRHARPKDAGPAQPARRSVPKSALRNPLNWLLHAMA